MKKHKLYKTWWSMRNRCYYEKHHNYANYGARGIRVCDRWLNDFWAFVEDMGPRPEGKTLDRIDVNGSYSPENCRWASSVEQIMNRRRKYYPEELLPGAFGLIVPGFL